MGSRQIVLVSTAGISVLNAGIFWRQAKTKRLFSQCIRQRALRQKEPKSQELEEGEEHFVPGLIFHLQCPNL
jgi:hypothetical protein